jgi:hypothetical protein
MEPGPVVGNTLATGLVAGAAADHVPGTDRAPIDVALPTPADTAAPLPPIPGAAVPAEPKAPAHELGPRFRADAAAGAALAAPPLVDIRDLNEFIIDMPRIGIIASCCIGDMKLFRLFIDDESSDVEDVDGEDDVDERGELSPCRVDGTADIVWDRVICVLVAADVPVAWATTTFSPASPVGSVVCGGGAKGFIIDAVADEAA